MKRSILFGKYFVAILFATLILQMGCKKEIGYHDVTTVVSTTGLNTYEYLKSKPGIYDSLLLAVDKLGIKATLTDSNVTLFAPANASFQIAIKNLNSIRKTAGQGPVYLTQIAAGDKNVIGSAMIKAKAKRDSAHLDTLVSRYIIRKLYVANDFAIGDGQMVYSVRGGYPMHAQRIFSDAEGFQSGGSEVIEYANTKRSLFVAKWSKTTTSSVNIKTKNGIVHLLKGDHVFGFDEFVSRLTLVPPPPNQINLKTDSVYVTWPAGFAYTDGQVSAGEVFKKLFDNSVLTKFICNTNVNGQIRYPTFYYIPRPAKIINCYTMTTANDSKTSRERDPRAWRMEATLDPNPGPSSVWTQVDVRQDQDWTTNYQQKIFDFANTTAYTGYRLIFLYMGTGSTSQALFQISEWTMNYRQQ
jgi:hypothetical protein